MKAGNIFGRKELYMIKEKNNRCSFPGVFLFISLALAFVFSLSVHAEDNSNITVRFLDAYGVSTGLPEQSVTSGQTLTLPTAPADTRAASAVVSGVPSWKPVKNKYNDYLHSSTSISYDQIKELALSYGNGNVLTLYSTKALRLAHYNSSGDTLYGESYYYEGTSATVNANPKPSQKAYRGWANAKGSSSVWAEFGQKITMQEDLNLYLVVYTRLRYFNKSGSKLLYTEYYSPGASVTLKTPPDVNNSRTLGWSTKKNGSSAAYSSGSKITLNKTLDLYAAYKYLPYTVRFRDNSGKNPSGSYNKLTLRAARGDYIKLPEVPKLNNYVALGWSTNKNDTAARKKEGEKVKITKSITYYAVYREARDLTISFVDENGSAPEAFAALNMAIKEGTEFTLPPLPEKEGYTASCWKISVNGTKKSYKAGLKLKAKGNCRFYASYVETVQAILYYNDGKTYMTVDLGKGSKYRLPSMENPEGYTFMGWGTKKGMRLNPRNPIDSYYLPGTMVTMKGTKHFYAILMKRSEEGSIVKGQLSGAGSPDTSAYKRIIIVGDSRTARLKLALDKQTIDYSRKNVTFIYQGGASLGWLKETGYPRVQSALKKEDSQDTRPVAVVFNMGVNGLDEYNAYASFYKEIAPELVKQNCRLFIMSVNPVNSAMIKKVGFKPRAEWQVRAFNTSIKKSLSGIYTYIDTCSWLTKTGYSTDRGTAGYDVGKDDGLHYTVNTYKRIYLRCLQFLAGEI